MNSRPSFVRLDVLEFFRWVDDHKEDLSSAVSNLARCLMLGKAEEGSYARKLLDEANEFRAKKSQAGRKGMKSRWSSSKDAASAADDCKAPPSVGYLVADGETREGSQNFANTGNRAHLESGTSATTSFGSARPARGAAAKRPLRNRGPTSKSEFEEFIYDPGHGINTALAWEWFDIHSARGWTDSGGKPLNNWKGALINYCKSKQEDKK